MKLKTKLLAATLLSMCSMSLLWAGNTIKSVTQCTESVSLTDAVDYVITGTTPFATTGSIDIVNADAVVIFKSLKPSKAKTYLGNIKINGAKAVDGTNCWLEIYDNGAIVYPHAELSFRPLTVFTESNFGGDAINSFVPYTTYTTGDWVNNIRSIKLKRGYMATIATNANGLGWSKCFIAQDEDKEIDFAKVTYGKYISGRAGFIRVFPWRRVTKKGTAGDPGQFGQLNATWRYGWDGQGYASEDFEYIPQHHHEGWPSWNEINGRTGVNTMLGNNEPDNSGDSREKYTPVEDIENVFFKSGSWANAYASGFRVGSPAMSGSARNSWLTTFMNFCNEYNYRIDFIADHIYWYSPGSSYSGDISSTSNHFGGRPVWLTEFNNGANWTSETWPTSDRSYSTANANHQLERLSNIITALEANNKLERHAVYNWVQDCRNIVLNGALTKAGEWFANLKSNTAYSDANEYTMGWNYKSPTDLTVNFYKSSKRVELKWNNLNGKQTDSTLVERKLDGEKTWKVIGVKGLQNRTDVTFSADTLTNYKGLAIYRVHTYDSDGRQRYSGEAYVSIGGAEGNDTFEFGSLTITDPTDPVNVEFSKTYNVKPYVFTGLQTQNNTKAVAEPYFTASTISKTAFDYQGLFWSKQSDSETSFKTPEEVPFLVTPADTILTYGDMTMQTGSILLKDTTEVQFSTPFPEGVTPVVITSCVRSAVKTNGPIMHKVWDVTNTGFKCVVSYEDGYAKKPATNQQLAYMAVTPGTTCIDEENGLYIAAGIGGTPLYSIARQAYFTVANDAGTLDTLMVQDPLIFGEIQSNNTPVPTVLRQNSLITTSITVDGEKTSYATGVRVRRIVDKSVTATGTDTKATADNVAWFVLYRGEAKRNPSAIEKPIIIRSENALNVHVINRIIYVDGYKDFDLYTIGGSRAASNATQTPGIYIIRAGGKTAKIQVK